MTKSEIITLINLIMINDSKGSITPDKLKAILLAIVDGAQWEGAGEAAVLISNATEPLDTLEEPNPSNANFYLSNDRVYFRVSYGGTSYQWKQSPLSPDFNR